MPPASFAAEAAAIVTLAWPQSLSFLLSTGLLTQGGQQEAPAPLAWRFLRVPTRSP